jgi:hypothetical protein
LATGAKAGRQLKRVTKTLTSITKRKVTLTLKLTKVAKRALADKGKLKIRVEAVYTPTGGPPGSKTRRARVAALPSQLAAWRVGEPGLYSPPEPFSHRLRVLRGGHRPAFFSAASRWE